MKNSVGLVKTQLARIDLPPNGLKLEKGGQLAELVVAYETYGVLNNQYNNAILVCHALSGDAHVAGFHENSTKPGWWDEMIGPGKGIDTDRFFVICANILGGCKGTTGPSSPDPASGRPYGSKFPQITLGDIVDVQHLLLRHLGVKRLYGVIGGSLGGMQVLEWSLRFPEMVDRCICIASAASLNAQALAFDIVGREAILSDPQWESGDYYDTGHLPAMGLAQARMIGHITYLSPQKMETKFGREKSDAAEPLKKFNTRFQVESYLHYNGRAFVDRFDANSYLHITEAMDSYDLEERFGSLDAAFAPVRAKMLIIALSSDWLFPPEQSLEVATALLRNGKQVSYCLLDSPHGHDAFLLDIAHLTDAVQTFLCPAPPPVAVSAEETARAADRARIRRMVAPKARILDLGCGDGQLLAELADSSAARPHLGIDIDLDNIVAALSRGLDVFQGDIDNGLGMIPDDSYDYVILSQTIQVVRKPRLVLKEMLRVARAGIVTFPNFSSLGNRLSLSFNGRMPISDTLPYAWYDTPNIHLATLKDFQDLCRLEGIRIEELDCLSDCPLGLGLIKLGLPNLGADRVLCRISRLQP
jgi:homoserine O-acetyltransferase